MSLPGRGASVGQAYVSIFADGKGLSRSIKDEFDANNKIFEEQGNKSHAAYKRGFDDEEKKHPFLDPKLADKSLRDLNSKIRSSKGSFDATGQFLGSAMAQKIRSTLIKELGDKDLGNRIFENISKGALQSGSIDEFERRLKNLGPEISRASKDIAKDQEDLRKATDKVTDSVRRLGDEGEKATRRIKNGTDDATKSATGLDKLFKSITHTDFGKFFGQGSRNNFFNTFGNLIGIPARALALFAVGGAIQLRNLAKVFKGTGEAGDTFLKRLGAAFGSLPGKVLNGLGAISTGILAIPVLLKIALIGVQAFIGPLAALITDLAGTIVALSSTIGFGLVFAVGSVLPLLAPLIAGIGVLTLAFSGLSTKAKAALKLEVKPLTQQFAQLRDAAQDALFGKNSINIKNEVKAAKPIIASLQPLITATGSGIAKSFLGFTKQLGGPAFKSFEKSMTKFIPDALYKFGKIGGNAFLGITGLIKDLVPFAQRLLNEFQRGTNAFAKFTNSAAGSNKISKFMLSAGISAHLLYRVLVDTGKVLADLLSAGKSTGDSLFGSFDKSLQTYDKFLNSTRGQKALAGFFAQTRSFLGALGNLVGGFGKFFGALNNGQSQNILNTLLTGFGGLLAIIAKNVPTAIPLLKDFATGVGVVFRALASIAQFVGQHEDIFRPIIVSLGALYVAGRLTGGKLAAGGLLGTLATGLKIGVFNLLNVVSGGSSSILTATQKLQGALTGLALVAGASFAGSKIKGAGGAAVGIGGGIIGGALIGSLIGPEGSAIGAVIGGVLGGVTGAIAHFWGNANQAAADAKNKQIAYIQSIQTAADSLSASISGIGRAYTDAARQQVIANLSVTPKGGGQSVVQLAQSINLSTRQLAEAVGGSQQAIQQIQDAVSAAEAVTQARLAATNRALAAARVAARGTSGGSPEQGVLAKAEAAQRAAAQAVKDQKANLDGLLASLGVQSKAVAKDIIDKDNQAESIGKLNLATRDLASQVLAYGTNLDLANAKTGAQNVALQRNREFITDSVSAYNATAVAQLKAGKSINAVTLALVGNIDQFSQSATAAGYNTKAVDTLIGSYLKVPKSVLTKLLAIDGADPVLRPLLDRLAKIPGLKTIVTAVENGTATLAQLDKIATALEKINNKTVTLTLHTVVNGAGASFVTGNGGRAFLPTAVGGTFTMPQVRMISEAGPEAVVPLRRPLSQVDPSVRALSAYAQGIPLNGSQQKTPVPQAHTRGGPTIVVQDGGSLISTPTTNANAIVSEMLARFATDGYSS